MNEPVSTVSIERVRQILETYGGNPDGWPEAERQAAAQRIQASTELQQLQQQAIELDSLIDAADTTAATDPAREQMLMERILQDLPAQAQNVTDLQQARNSRGLPRRLRLPALLSAIAASVIVFTVLVQQPASVMQPQVSPGQQAFEQWAWAEITDQLPDDDLSVDQGVDGFMGLVDLESDEV
jgi:hypothetical protein